MSKYQIRLRSTGMLMLPLPAPFRHADVGPSAREIPVLELVGCYLPDIQHQIVYLQLQCAAGTLSEAKLQASRPKSSITIVRKLE